MNKTLTALQTKLSWQRNDLNLLLAKIDEELTALQEKLAQRQEQIHKAAATPAIINPEHEIARLNFMVRCQQEHENLTLEKKELKARQSQLKVRHLRKTCELKKLEKYQLNKEKDEKEKALLIEQKEIDEWVLLRRKMNGN
jgi:chromosome segregation ATPase